MKVNSWVNAVQGLGVWCFRVLDFVALGDDFRRFARFEFSGAT